MFARIVLAAAALISVPSAALAQQATEAAAPTLKPGVAAPQIAVEKWLKGSPVASFEKGKVYVVEFWATWCGPCIASMPHISALQQEYKDKGVTIIGTNIWEDKRGTAYDDKTLGKIEEFVAKQGDRMSYSVAYDGPARKMDASFMQAGGRKGIPSAFIVDKNGMVAWMGHPGSMDFALSEIVAGTWDVTTGPEREKKCFEQLRAIGSKLESDPAGAQAEFQKFEAAYPAVAKHQDDLRLGLLKASGQWDKAYAIMGHQVDDAITRKDAMTLNQIAWGIVDPEAKVEKRDLELALRAADKAAAFTMQKDGAILDTLARVHAWKGDYKKALELQTLAVEVADPKMKDQLKAALEEYKTKAASN